MKFLYQVSIRVDDLNVRQFWIVSEQDLAGLATYAGTVLEEIPNLTGDIEKVERIGRAFVDTTE